MDYISLIDALADHLLEEYASPDEAGQAAINIGGLATRLVQKAKKEGLELKVPTGPAGARPRAIPTDDEGRFDRLGPKEKVDMIRDLSRRAASAAFATQNMVTSASTARKEEKSSAQASKKALSNAKEALKRLKTPDSY